MNKNFDPVETEIITKPSRHNFPDVIFPDGRVMVYDEILEKYIDAPADYMRTDVMPFVAGEIKVIPYIDNIPTDEQLRRRREHIRVQWLVFGSFIAQSALVIGVVLAAFAAGGYLWQVIRAFGQNGAPRVAELTGLAIGHILSIVLYILAGIVIVFALISFFGSLRNSGGMTYQPAAGGGVGGGGDYGAGGANQNININIAGRDFSGGNDPAQKIIQ